MKTQLELLKRYGELRTEQINITSELNQLNEVASLPFEEDDIAKLRNLMKRDFDISRELRALNDSYEIHKLIASAA